MDGGFDNVVAAVDIGGTFTDCVLINGDGRVSYGKALSSPGDDFQSGFFSSLESAAARAGLSKENLYKRLATLVCHGSTVATNILVESKGARVGVLTTKGHEDTIIMMRGLGRVTGEPPENILRVAQTSKPDPIVPRERIRGVTERVDSVGRIVVKLDEAQLEAQVRELVSVGCDAIAICFLWSIQNPEHERRAKEIVRRVAPKAFVSVSHELTTAVGEYERTVAAAINAFVGPKTYNYLTKLNAHLKELGFGQGLRLMQSHGGMVPLQRGTDHPLLTIGSGPVGGMVGTQRLAEQLGIRDIIATDMGGTSFDVGIIKDLEPEVSAETVLGKYTYKIPAVEVLSIGAGGGSIAWIDPHSRSLRVGPHSASSNPGPACYDRGGVEPTVTDANLVLGYLNPDAVFGTAGDRQIRPRRDLALQAVKRVADPLGLSVEDAALGIVEIINAKMANALQRVIVGRGFDPRDFAILSYGGSGPLHVAGYARELDVSQVIIPGQISSVWSAFGIGLSDIRYQRQKDVQLITPFDPVKLDALFAGMEAELAEQVGDATAKLRRFGRVRYHWQRNELEIPFAPHVDARSFQESLRSFERIYQQRYGSASLVADAAFEIVALRVEAILPSGTHASSNMPDAGTTATGAVTKRIAHFVRGRPGEEASVYDGRLIAEGVEIAGPAIVDLATTAIVVPHDATVTATKGGNFALVFHKKH